MGLSSFSGLQVDLDYPPAMETYREEFGKLYGKQYVNSLIDGEFMRLCAAYFSGLKGISDQNGRIQSYP